MRRILIPALMITLLLSGCGDAAPERKLEELRNKLNAAAEIHVIADVAADLGAEQFTCSLDCRASAEETTVELTAPEAVAGVRARIGPDGMTVEYDGVALGVGGVPNGKTAPVNALPLLLAALKTGSTLRKWTERDADRTLYVREFYVTDDDTLTVWQDGETLLPVCAEFTRGGAAVLRCEIREFTYE